MSPQLVSLSGSSAWKVTAWRRSQQSGERLVLRQVLHWLAIAGFVALDFAIQGTGVETQVSAGLNSLS